MKSERSELFTKILKISGYLCWEIFIFGSFFLVNCSLKKYVTFWVHFLGKNKIWKMYDFQSKVSPEISARPLATTLGNFFEKPVCGWQQKITFVFFKGGATETS